MMSYHTISIIRSCGSILEFKILIEQVCVSCIYSNLLDIVDVITFFLLLDVQNGSG
jgi:hypothetical protein